MNPIINTFNAFKTKSIHIYQFFLNTYQLQKCHVESRNKVNQTNPGYEDLYILFLKSSIESYQSGLKEIENHQNTVTSQFEEHASHVKRSDLLLELGRKSKVLYKIFKAIQQIIPRISKAETLPKIVLIILSSQNFRSLVLMLIHFLEPRILFAGIYIILIEMSQKSYFFNGNLVRLFEE